MFEVYHGDSRVVLKDFDDNSIDAVVTDPPYGLSDCSPKKVRQAISSWVSGEEHSASGGGFMNKSWDSFVPGPTGVFGEMNRVLKPGGHALVFCAPRNMGLVSVSLQLANFEIRDCFCWLFGSGMPKSHSVDKALDKLAGATREVVGEQILQGNARTLAGGNYGGGGTNKVPLNSIPLTVPASPLAKTFSGWGSGLKPGYEGILLLRKPLEGTIAENVREWSTGGINIDGCRVPSPGEHIQNNGRSVDSSIYSPLGAMAPRQSDGQKLGRFPANVILDEEAAKLLDMQTGELKGGRASQKSRAWGVGAKDAEARFASGSWQAYGSEGYEDRGGASRFFYCAKASRREKELGLDDCSLEEFHRFESGEFSGGEGKRNSHVTVKPLDLMKYLVRLVTPPGGVVLDPYCGSGSTGCAAVSQGYAFVGIEQDIDFADIARARIFKSRH